MASSSSDTSLDVGSSSGSDSDDEQLGHDGWGDRGGGGWEDRDHEASPMAMNGQDAAFEDAMAAACRNAESDEAKRNSQGSAGEATAALDPATDDEPAAAANPAAAAEPAASRRRHTSSRDADTPAAAAIGGEAANVLAKAAAAPPPTLGARISKTNDDGDEEMFLQKHVPTLDTHDRQIVWGESQSDEVSRSLSLCLVFARSTLSSDNLH